MTKFNYRIKQYYQNEKLNEHFGRLLIKKILDIVPSIIKDTVLQI